MIRKVKHQDIDREKYQNCIINAINYRIYAEDWYLDNHTNRQWDCFVYDDYEAVMPLPLISKFGFKLISQPIFCQQLGIFYNKEVDEDILHQFSNEFKKLKVINYQFNEENLEYYSDNVIIKKNYILNLNLPYEEIRKGFRRDRKSDIHKIKKLNLSISTEIDLEILIQELKKKYPYFMKYYNKSWFNNLMEAIIKRKCYKYYELKDESELVSSAFFLHSKKRFILLLLTRNEKHEHRGATTFLINHFIKNHSEQDLLLDFEGSNVAGIADFYKSFGAVVSDYQMIQFYKKDILKNIIKFKF